MNRIKPLPHWVLTDLQPAFYDAESGTALQMIARIYPKIEELIKDYNNFVDEINHHIEEYEDDLEIGYDKFRNCIIKTMNDYIKTIDTMINLQDTKIDNKFNEIDRVVDDAVNYMKTNLMASITSLVNEMKISGELDQAILDAFENLGTRVNTLETNVVNLLSDIETINTSLLNIGRTLETNTSDIDNLKEDNTTNKSDISLLQEKVAEHTDNLQELTDNVNTYELTNDTNIRNINTIIGGLTNAFIIVDNVSDMLDTEKIYINTTDDNWYYYNGTNWVIGGSIVIPGIISDFKYNDIHHSLRRMVVSSPNMDLGYKENAQNIITSDSYYFNGKITNNSNLDLVFRLKAYDYNLNEITVTPNTFTLESGEYYQLDSDILYSFEIMKESLEVFTSEELAHLRATVLYTRDVEQTQILDNSLAYSKLNDSLKLLVNPNRTITLSRVDEYSVKIDEDLYYGIIKNTTGSTLNMIIEVTGSDTPIETTLANNQSYTITENEGIKYNFTFSKTDETEITSSELVTIQNGITYKEIADSPLVIPDNYIHYSNLDQNLRSMIQDSDYEFTVYTITPSNLQIMNTEGVVIEGVTIHTLFPALKYVNKFSDPYSLSIVKYDLEGEEIETVFNNVPTVEQVINLESGYLYDFSLHRMDLITPGYTSFSEEDKTLLATQIELKNLKSVDDEISDLDSRVTDLESDVSDLDTRVTDLESDVSDLDTRVTDLENERIVYSTTEVKTNEIYVDENDDEYPIYTRIFRGTTLSSASTNTLLNSSDMKELLSYNGNILDSSNNKFSLPTSWGSDGNATVRAFITSSGGLALQVGSAYFNRPYKLIIKYTKTTDNPTNNTTQTDNTETI